MGLAGVAAVVVIGGVVIYGWRLMRLNNADKVNVLRRVEGHKVTLEVVRPGSRPLRLRKVLCRQQTPAPNACSEPLIGVHRLSIAARDRVAVKVSPAPGSIARPQTFRIRLMAAKQGDSYRRDPRRNQSFRCR